MKLLDMGHPFPTTDEEAMEYLPNDPSALGLYRVRRAQGDTIAAAMEKVFRAMLPDETLMQQEEA